MSDSQIIARDRTDNCARDLVDALIKKFSEVDKINSPLSNNTDTEENLVNDEEDLHAESDCTSILVFRFLDRFFSHDTLC